MPNLKDVELLTTFLEDEKGSDVTVINVSNQTSIADYMIIVTARSGRHAKALANTCMEKMKANGLVAISAHGLEQGEWVLVDFNDIILHIMTPESRAFYHIEGLWKSE